MSRVVGIGLCAKCGGSLPEKPDAGRPASYCSTACRRSAEFEIRRQDRQLADLEKKMREHREAIAVPGTGYQCCRDRELHLEFFRREVADIEARFRVLLGAESSDK